MENVGQQSSNKQGDKSHPHNDTILDLEKTMLLDFKELEEEAFCESSGIPKSLDVPEASKDSPNSFVGELEENLLNGNYKDLQECFEAYNQYGFAMGFSIRKGKQYYFTGTRDPKFKWYFCSCEGVKNEKYSARASYNKFDIRTECEAKISFEKGKDGVWKVTNFVKEHNHVLALPHERHFLRSQRRITKSTGDLLETFVNSGIRPVDGISYLIEESGGPENVSFTQKDAYNYLQSLRNTKMKAGDVGGLLSYFRNKKDEDPMFDWDFELDTEGRLANLFWRDGKSRLDYDYFGDVVSFDTTYRTNKYGLKCAVFVGVNNHWKNVIFGCAFLSWETTDSFEWLFSTFLRLMGGKQPTTIFTDQAQAIINVIDRKLPETRHRLCQWHISQNATSHIGSLNGNPQFWSLLHKCYSKCDTEEEFEETWIEIKSLCSQGNKWLDRLYNLQHRWSTTFNNDVFNAGIKSTSRSESTNRVLNGMSNLTTSLHDFIVAFEKKILCKWRENERHEDFRCAYSRVPRADKSSPLLLHASQVYTHTMYKFFENELTRSSLSYSSVEIPLGESRFNFQVYKKINQTKVKIVSVDMNTLEVKCPCKKFESTGILCRHSLRALDMKNVKRIPERYIVKRWQKDVKDSTDIEKVQSCNLEKEYDEPGSIYRNCAMRFAYGIISRSQPDKEARSIVWEFLRNGNEKVKKLFQNKTPDELPPKVDRNLHCHVNVNLALDPQCIRPKGGKNQRKKSHLEKGKKQNKRSSNTTSGKGKRKKVVPSVLPTTASTLWPDALLHPTFEM